jgi:D-sedoheptulose 7-phosphate isomerase
LQTKKREPAAATSAYLELARQHVQDSVSIKQKLGMDAELMSRTVKVARMVSQSLRRERKLLLFGNGGSAADAQHIAAEFVSKYRQERRPLAALALTVNTSCLTAIGNDFGFDLVFSRQMEAFGTRGDVAIGISTSGNSENVLQALKVARKMGITTVGLTGKDGGRMKSRVDYCLAVPSNDTARIQECHILLGHIICQIAEQNLFGK